MKLLVENADGEVIGVGTIRRKMKFQGIKDGWIQYVVMVNGDARTRIHVMDVRGMDETYVRAGGTYKFSPILPDSKAQAEQSERADPRRIFGVTTQ